jgi:hypothetical protein
LAEYPHCCHFLQRASYFHSGSFIFLIIALISYDDTWYRTRIKQ